MRRASESRYQSFKLGRLIAIDFEVSKIILLIWIDINRFEIGCEVRWIFYLIERFLFPLFSNLCCYRLVVTIFCYFSCYYYYKILYFFFILFGFTRMSIPKNLNFGLVPVSIFSTVFFDCFFFFLNQFPKPTSAGIQVHSMLVFFIFIGLITSYYCIFKTFTCILSYHIFRTLLLHYSLLLLFSVSLYLFLNKINITRGDI